MDRKIVEDHLQQAREHVSSGRQHIKRQRVLVAELERDGHDTIAAELLLRTFQETLELHLNDVARLKRELAELDSTS